MLVITKLQPREWTEEHKRIANHMKPQSDSRRFTHMIPGHQAGFLILNTEKSKLDGSPTYLLFNEDGLPC